MVLAQEQSSISTTETQVPSMQPSQDLKQTLSQEIPKSNDSLSNEQQSKIDMSQSLQELREEIKTWGLDSNNALQQLVELQAMNDELTSYLMELKTLYESLILSTDAEVQGYKDKITLLEEVIKQTELKIKVLQNELLIWKIGTVLVIITTTAFNIFMLIK